MMFQMAAAPVLIADQMEFQFLIRMMMMATTATMAATMASNSNTGGLAMNRPTAKLRARNPAATAISPMDSGTSHLALAPTNSMNGFRTTITSSMAGTSAPPSWTFRAVTWLVMMAICPALVPPICSASPPTLDFSPSVISA